jgi:ATP/maltotriose-dependent transcriptional regulator MalT
MGMRRSSMGGNGRAEVVIDSSSDIAFDPARIVLKPILRVPAPSPEQLVCSRLLELLRDTSGCKITLVSAPAGYGKTALLARWWQAAQSNVPFAWISLDLRRCCG